MARFEPMIDDLSMDLQKLGQITEEDAFTILTPAGELVKEKFTEKIRSVFAQRTGKLAAAIQSFKRVEDGPSILIYPDGPHHRYRSRKTKGTKTATAAEVGFVLEYGSVRVKATHWMENALRENDEAIGQKMQEGFDAFCDEKGIP
jgi:hypothetical protein